MTRSISSTAAPARVTGTVKWFNDAKGYGFIVPDDSDDRDDECFVHFSSLPQKGRERKTIADGTKVVFDRVTGAKGPEAKNVEELVDSAG